MSNKGLYGKYIIQKSDGSPRDPNAQYFVLRIDTDVHARAALLYYADRIRFEQREFAKQLQDWVLDQPGCDCPTCAHLKRHGAI